MFQLVSLADVKSALRVTTADDDGILGIYISAASHGVLAYLGDQAGDLLGIDSPPNSPPDDLNTVDERVKVAVIMLAGIIYREPDGDAAHNFEQGFLPAPVTALLYPMRDPALG